VSAKILLVEDDPDLSYLYREDLQQEGYEVQSVDNGKAAIAKVKDYKPDLVIMDIVMPKMDGIEAMWNILSENRELPVIIYSGHPQYRENFMTWGAEDFIVKSSDTAPLKDAIRAVLERKAGQSEQDR
jgi:DNA-binding response OmpR family regulator